jgi:hypothetical protein
MRTSLSCRIVNGNIIPYLDFAHSNLLPEGMRKHMNKNVMLSLSPIVSSSKLDVPPCEAD